MRRNGGHLLGVTISERTARILDFDLATPQVVETEHDVLESTPAVHHMRTEKRHAGFEDSGGTIRSRSGNRVFASFLTPAPVGRGADHDALPLQAEIRHPEHATVAILIGNALVLVILADLRRGGMVGIVGF